MEEKPFVDGYGWFHCTCTASHNRGPVDGESFYRCLKCGRGFKSPEVRCRRTTERQKFHETLVKEALTGMIIAMLEETELGRKFVEYTAENIIDRIDSEMSGARLEKEEENEGGPDAV
jgi:hypothetical protein